MDITNATTNGLNDNRKYSQNLPPIKGLIVIRHANGLDRKLIMNKHATRISILKREPIYMAISDNKTLNMVQ